MLVQHCNEIRLKLLQKFFMPHVLRKHTAEAAQPNLLYVF